MTTEGPGADPSGDGFGMTALEERMQGPEGREVHAAAVSRMTQLLHAIDASVEAGLGPMEFKRAETIRIALAAARAFVSGAP